MKAWRVHRHGPPAEVLALDEIDPPEPGPGQVRVAVSHTVLNKNDVDGCLGRYRTVSPALPYVARMEVTGTVDAAGPGAEAWLGRRVVACPDQTFGGFAERAVAPLDLTFEAPPALDGRADPAGDRTDRAVRRAARGPGGAGGAPDDGPGGRGALSSRIRA